MLINPDSTYIYLAPDGASHPVPGGDHFWSLSKEEIEKFGNGWLVVEYTCTEDWPTWEMHPAGDELVYLLEGDAELLLDRPEGIQTTSVTDRGLVLVPRGVWHTARIHAPSRMLNITMGSGTQHRPVT
jgi:hypothetical protein